MGENHPALRRSVATRSVSDGVGVFGVADINRLLDLGADGFERPAPIDWLPRLLHRPKLLVARRDSIPLPELNEGESSEVVCLNCKHASRRSAFAVYGLVPGSRVVLQQKRPSYVIRLGETDLALDIDIANTILVRRVVAPFEVAQ